MAKKAVSDNARRMKVNGGDHPQFDLHDIRGRVLLYKNVKATR